MPKHNLENELLIEQYKEVVSNRRHYSSLRFALFPVFFALQYGVIQLVFKGDASGLTLPVPFYTLGGILIAYAFWTIEERISSYYTHLENVAEELEDQLGFDLIKRWPKSTILSNTRFSIRFVYIVFLIFWTIILIKELI